MNNAKGLSLVFVFALFTEKAYADFPLPNKTTPFTESGRTYVYEFEYVSYAGVVYTTYCPSTVPYLTLEAGLDNGWWKLLPHYIYNYGNCQTYKYLNETSTWVQTWEVAWNYYLDRMYSLSDLIRTNADIYYMSGWPTINFSWQYGNLGIVTSGQKLLSRNWDFTWNEPYIPTKLQFPIYGFTAYTVPVSSVMDHDMVAPYQEDGVVSSFEGEYGNNDPSQDCYAKVDNLNFGISINYVGTSGTGGRSRLCYDGHPGYDFAILSGAAIYSLESGTLCVGLLDDQYSDNLWRDPEKCPYPASIRFNDYWPTYHTFYMKYEGKWINGVRDDYIVKFLHSGYLATNIQEEVESLGYAMVSRNDIVAASGATGTGSPHVHMEVFKRVDDDWVLVDPYGDGVNGVLW